MLKGSHVKWFIDCEVAAKIVEFGNQVCIKWPEGFLIFIRLGFHLEVQWIPRTSNQQADYINRLIDTDDWQITDEIFS